jgi:hypothetical protein
MRTGHRRTGHRTVGWGTTGWVTGEGYVTGEWGTGGQVKREAGDNRVVTGGGHRRGGQVTPSTHADQKGWR